MATIFNINNRVVIPRQLLKRITRVSTQCSLGKAYDVPAPTPEPPIPPPAGPFLYSGGSTILQGNEFDITGSTATYNYIYNTAKIDNPENVIHISCGDQHLNGNLNILNCVNMREFECDQNSFTTLNCSNLNTLQLLRIEKNLTLSTVNISNCNLLYLFCANDINLDLQFLLNNYTTELTNLNELDCSYMNLSALNLPVLNSLTALYCYQNSMQDLDMSNVSGLKFLDCNETYTLSSLNLNSNIILNDINCSSNTLTTLNLTNNNELTYFDCNTNHITDLDLNNKINLQEIWAYTNPLTNVNISGCSSLQIFDCNPTTLPQEAVDNILYALTLIPVGDYVDMSGGTSSPPSEIGLTYVNTLTSTGWKIFVNT